MKRYALLIIAIFLIAVFSPFFEEKYQYDLNPESEVKSSSSNTFNTTYTDQLNHSILELDFAVGFPSFYVTDFQIIDFSQSVDGSYLVMLYSRSNPGTMWNGNSFRAEEPILLHADKNGTFTKSVVLSHQYKQSGGAWTLVDFVWQHSGPTSLIDPLDMDENIVIAGSLGDRWERSGTNTQVSYRIENFVQVNGTSQQIFMLSLNRTTFAMEYSITIPSSSTTPSTTSDFCEFAVSENSFVNETIFSIGIAFYVDQVSWGGSCSTVINSQTFTVLGPNTYERRTNLVLTSDFYLNVQNVIEIDGAHHENSLPYFSQNGGMIWSEKTSTSNAFIRDVQVRSPSASSWTNADVSNCSTSWRGSGLGYIPTHGSVFDQMILSCISTTSNANGSEVFLGTVSTTTGNSLNGYFVGTCGTQCFPRSILHPTPTIALLRMEVGSSGTFYSPYGTTFYSSITLLVNLTNGAVSQAPPTFQFDFKESGGDNSDTFLLSTNDFAHPVTSGLSSFMFMQWGEGDAGELKIIEIDSDLDSYPDRIDVFPNDSSQHIDSDGDSFGDNSLGFNGDDCVYQSGNSTIDLAGCPDNDGDGYSNQGDSFINDFTQVFDSDTDGYGDNVSGNLGDACPLTYGESTRDRYGCPDSDFDGWSDINDSFENDSSQWADIDGDGYGDQLNGFEGDSCPNEIGTSTEDRYGCIDADGDGFSDEGDDLPQNPTQWVDRDGDGYGDNQEENATMSDAFPADGTQWNDTDEDGHGDNPFGTQGDWFPNDPTRWQDSDQDGVADEDDAFPNNPTQSTDSDGDGYGDNPNGTDYDDFPFDTNEWLDTDNDGIGDNTDQYPYDPSQTIDSDGDGYGDNTNGTRGDAFPEDSSEWLDTDGDGVGDNSDDLPFNPSQTSDADGDGFGDEPTGTGADPFPNDPTQWVDADGDGYGDNAEGNNPDLFPRDITQWFDRDGDGFGDNPNGVNPDAFPDDSTQWVDDDDDDLGDNPNGTNPDPSINDYDNDGYLDIDDPFPQTSSPGDKDNDGVLDENDAFPDNFREFSDNDGDGDGDIEDLDDDNDGYLDEDEIRSNSDPLDPNSQPVEGFEVIIPGTAISLGAWDLIGIFGGVPLFGWIGFGFLTRNKRCAKYEELLKTASTRDELEKVALRWEYSLMLRMLGPHQGIRLERLRAELDDKFENASYDETEIGIDQTNLVENENKDLPPINDSIVEPNKETTATSTDDSGYEWFKQGEENWYRPIGSKDEWIKFEIDAE